ncbi:MAG: threonine synthase [Chloroflexi bacterium]|nr:threonine synthase [Chloroflexota bacterium]
MPSPMVSPPTTSPPATSSRRVASSFVLGLACRRCSRAEEMDLAYVCRACFGPLEVVYDYARIAATIDRESIGSRPPGIWRYRELLPLHDLPTKGLTVGSTPLVCADRLAPTLGLDRLWIKDDTRNPSLSFKDRPVAIAAARAHAWQLAALACASTGNLAGATALAAAVLGMPAYVFVPADLEPAKLHQAVAFGATVVPLQGTYDDVNRVCIELADETGWGFVNINLRPFYAEGSRTLAFEIAEQLGWRSPDVVVAPIASGALFTKLGRGFDELAAVGLIERKAIRFVGGQAEGCAPVANACDHGTEAVTPVKEPDTFVRSLAIGSPADGAHAVRLAMATGGSVEAVSDIETARAIRAVAGLEGIYPETAGGVTLAAAAAARRRGVIHDGDEVVALLTGNGLKTPDAVNLGQTGRRVRPGEPGLAAALPASFGPVATWLEGGT